MVAHHFEELAAGGGRGEIEQGSGGAIGDPDRPGRIDDDQPFDHAVEQGRRALLLLAQLGLAPRPVQVHLVAMADRRLPGADAVPPPPVERGGEAGQQDQAKREHQRKTWVAGERRSTVGGEYRRARRPTASPDRSRLSARPPASPSSRR